MNHDKIHKFCKDNNILKSLYGCPKNVVGYFFVLDNPLETLDGYNNFEDLYYKYLTCDNKEKLVSKYKKNIRNIRMKTLLESI